MSLPGFDVQDLMDTGSKPVQTLPPTVHTDDPLSSSVLGSPPTLAPSTSPVGGLPLTSVLTPTEQPVQQGPSLPYDRYKDPVYQQNPLGENLLKKRKRDVSLTAGDVRQSGGTGVGWHEFVPTDMRNEVRHDDRVSGLQATMRSRTSKQNYIHDGRIGGHSGHMKPRSGVTKGQSKWHDKLRDVTRKTMKSSTSSSQLLAQQLLAQDVNTTPNGLQLLESDDITGWQPKDTHLQSLGSSIEAPDHSDPVVRKAYAKHCHRERETSKRKARKLTHGLSEDDQELVYPMSPPRVDLDDGGGYATEVEPLSPPPVFSGEGVEQSANIGFWATSHKQGTYNDF